MSVVTLRQQTIQQLALQIRRQEAGGGAPISTGIGALDRLLPVGGMRPGTLLEWLSPLAGSGVGTLACLVAGELLRGLGSCLVIDPRGTFSPPGAWGLHGFLERTVVVRPADAREALWVLEQALRCPGVRVVVGWCDRLSNAAYRRLQLAAEAGGGVGLLLRPGGCRSEPSWADARLWVEPLPSKSRRERVAHGRVLRVEAIYCRGRAAGSAVELEIDDETGDVRPAARLGAATAALRATGA